MKIGFQGVSGAYSEEGIIANYPEASTVGFDTSEEVIAALNNKTIEFAFLPVENSIYGGISNNYDLLLREDLWVIGEQYHEIKHCLLGLKDTNILNIKNAYSHPAALGQCREWLLKNKIKPIPKYDTAGSAKDLQGHENSAIASCLCAKKYNLQILANDISESKKNYTRFFLICKKENAPKEELQEKTSIVFRTYHKSGALLEILEILSKYSINMTKLESRPVPQDPFQYAFFVDFEGGIYEENIMKAMTEIAHKTPYHKILGSYKKGKKIQN